MIITSRTSLTVPAQVKLGSVIEIRAIAQHDMETGFRYSEQGKLAPRNILRRFSCRYNNKEIFRMELHPGMGANPLVIFTALATDSGTIEVQWTGDNDYEAINQASITVT